MKSFVKLSIAPLLFAVILIGCCKEESRTCTCTDSTGNIQSEKVLRSHDMREIEKFEENCVHQDSPKCGKKASKPSGTASSTEADYILPTTPVVTTCEVK